MTACAALWHGILPIPSPSPCIGPLCRREALGAEQINGRLKDESVGRNIRVRGYDKFLAHLMYGTTVLAAGQLRNFDHHRIAGSSNSSNPQKSLCSGSHYAVTLKFTYPPMAHVWSHHKADSPHGVPPETATCIADKGNAMLLRILLALALLLLTPSALPAKNPSAQVCSLSPTEQCISELVNESIRYATLAAREVHVSSYRDTSYINISAALARAGLAEKAIEIVDEVDLDIRIYVLAEIVSAQANSGKMDEAIDTLQLMDTSRPPYSDALLDIRSCHGTVWERRPSHHHSSKNRTSFWSQ